jgi:hypothetical protein
MKKKNVFVTMAMAATMLSFPVMISSCHDDDDEKKEQPVIVNVTSVTLDTHEKSLFAKDELQLTATIVPINATNQTLTWKSGDYSIATVTNTGLVTAISAGETYIYVSAENGLVSDSCLVSIVPGIKIEDKDFLSALLSDKDINTDKDSFITRTEAEAVKTLDLSSKSISSLAGIEYFSNLEELNCSENKLSALDVTKLTKLNYLKCNDNKIAELDLSKNAKLTYLHCAKNELTTLNIKNCPDLETIVCGNQASTLKLNVTVDQYNNVWKENYSDANVDIVLNIFENAVFQSATFEKNVSNGETVKISKKESTFNFRLYNGETNENMTFFEESVLKSLEWSSSDESIATLTPNVTGSDESYSILTKVSLLAIGKTTITAKDGEGNTLSFVLEVTK